MIGIKIKSSGILEARENPFLTNLMLYWPRTHYLLSEIFILLIPKLSNLTYLVVELISSILITLTLFKYLYFLTPYWFFKNFSPYEFVLKSWHTISYQLFSHQSYVSAGVPFLVQSEINVPLPPAELFTRDFLFFYFTGEDITFLDSISLASLI